MIYTWAQIEAAGFNITNGNGSSARVKINQIPNAKIVVPNGITYIGNGGLADLTTVDTIILSDSVTDLDMNVFSGDGNVKTIVMPSGIKRFKQTAFFNVHCTIKYKGTKAQWNAIRKDYSWDWHMSLKVICTDGTLSVN